MTSLSAAGQRDAHSTASAFDFGGSEIDRLDIFCPGAASLLGGVPPTAAPTWNALRIRAC